MTKPTAERDALVSKHFPKQWADVADAPGKGKKRTQLRKWAEQAEVTEGLRKQGASCGNCSLFCPDGYRGRSYCSADSDFHGYSMVQPNHLCHMWSEKETP